MTEKMQKDVSLSRMCEILLPPSQSLVTEHNLLFFLYFSAFLYILFMYFFLIRLVLISSRIKMKNHI